MSDEIKDLINNSSNLISLPEISIRVNEMVDDPNVNSNDIGKVISQDPMLAARLLKIANSPFYGLTTEIDTVSRAITILGTKAIRNLVISTEASHAFDGIPNNIISMRDFWHHSLYCGLLAQILAKQSKKLNSEAVFISGLLHDIGQLLMFNRLPEKALKAIELSMEGPGDLDMYQAEQEIFGFDHTQVGAELIKAWNLPGNIRESIEFHHSPLEADEFPVEAALIHIANAAAVMAELNSFKEEDLPEINPACWEITGLTKEILATAVEQAQQEISDIEAILFPSS